MPNWVVVQGEDGWVHNIPWDDKRHRPAPFHAVDIMCSCFPTLEAKYGPLSPRLVVHHDATWPDHTELDAKRMN